MFSDVAQDEGTSRERYSSQAEDFPAWKVQTSAARLDATAQAFRQVPGPAVRMSAEGFNEAVPQSEVLRTLLLRYTQALCTQVAQSAACNRRHLTKQRLSRWLLMTQDRVQLNEFPIEQDFLAAMLTVRATDLTEAAGALQAQGLIRQGRGKIVIVDVNGQEKRPASVAR